jgi:hypothetical protein
MFHPPAARAVGKEDEAVELRLQSLRLGIERVHDQGPCARSVRQSGMEKI